jgi:membrane-bound lytic murein transglycosylase D
MAAAAIKSTDGVYTVRRGDTVSLIATRHGVTEQALLAVNGIQDPHLIYPGQQISLPGFGQDAKIVAALGTDVSPMPGTLPQAEQADEPPEHAASTVPSEPELPVALVSAAQNPQPTADAEQLPTAAGSPDDQQLEPQVTAAEEMAIALDPDLEPALSNAQIRQALAADPSDYSVASNNSIEIQASETLGHYADWLGIQTREVRRLNKLAFGDPVIIGGRLRLDFSKVSKAEFELKRREYHAALQSDFFIHYRIKGVEEYQVKPNDNIGMIARKRYATPIWLLRQYNPDLDFNSLQIAQKIIFPLLEKIVL